MSVTNQPLVVSGYIPRVVFKDFHARTKRFVVIVAHRRCGKTVAVMNDLITRALFTKKKSATYGYFCPTYSQAKGVAWTMLKDYTEGIAHLCKFNETETSVVFPNGAKIRLYGADNPDSHRGLRFDGVVLDEFGDMKPEMWTKVASTAIRDRKGWAIFIGTPKGKNKFYEMLELAQKHPNKWFTGIYRYSDTSKLTGKPGAPDGPPLSKEEYEDDCLSKDDDEIAAEYECSFDAAIKGAVYGRWLTEIEQEGRVKDLPWVPDQPVYTGWDIGWSDDTCIWFFQIIRGEIRFFDYYSCRFKTPYEISEDLARKGYMYSTMFLPHDAKHTDQGSGMSYIDQLLDLGLPAQIIPYHKVRDGIEHTRRTLCASYFDATRCAEGLLHLKAYQKREDTKTGTLAKNPVHNKASHAADAMRYAAMSLSKELVMAALPKKRKELLAQTVIKKYVEPEKVNTPTTGWTFYDLLEVGSHDRY